MRPGRCLVAWAFGTSCVLVGLGTVPGSAGEPAAMLALSGLVMPLQEVDVAIPSATVEIRLPRADEHYVAVRTEYQMRNDSDRATPLKVAVPVHGQFVGLLYAEDRDPKPAVKLDQDPVPYSCRGFEELAEPYLEQWAAKGWELLGATDPELKAQLEALDPTNDQVPEERREAFAAHVRAKADRWGDRAEAWAYDVVKLLVFRDLYRFDWELFPTEVCQAMLFLDSNYTHDAYDLERLLAEDWSFDSGLMRDPYNGRLYGPDFSIFRQPNGRQVRVLQLDLTLEPKHTHRLAVFHRQPPGYDLTKRSRQFCFVTGNAGKWRDCGPIHWTIRWPKGTSRISFTQGADKRYWRAGDSHNASFSTGQQDIYIGWVQ